MIEPLQKDPLDAVASFVELPVSHALYNAVVFQVFHQSHDQLFHQLQLLVRRGLHVELVLERLDHRLALLKEHPDANHNELTVAHFAVVLKPTLEVVDSSDRRKKVLSQSDQVLQVALPLLEIFLEFLDQPEVRARVQRVQTPQQLGHVRHLLEILLVHGLRKLNLQIT